MTEEQVRAALRKAVSENGGQRAFSREHGMSATYVGLILAGGTPGERICEAIGIEKNTVTTYRKIRP